MFRITMLNIDVFNALLFNIMVISLFNIVCTITFNVVFNPACTSMFNVPLRHMDGIVSCGNLLHIVEGRRTLVERHALPCEPPCVDAEHGGEEAFDLRTWFRLPVDVLAHMAASELDAVFFGRFDEIALPYVAQVHRLVEALREEIGQVQLPSSDVQNNNWEPVYHALNTTHRTLNIIDDMMPLATTYAIAAQALFKVYI
nr:hypothetical protein [Bifidobacterium criceti]